MRRALLLGCQGDDLAGVPADLATMRALLDRYAFTDVVSLLDGERAAMLAAIRALVERSGPGDAVALYYSGHGWRVDVPGRRGDGRPGDFQGIAPADFNRSTAADFRGILADELSALLDELTERTANVTVILDCCHATGTTRGGATTGVRAMPVPWTVPPAEFAAALRAQGLLRERPDAETNPLAVRLYACRPHETAGEAPGDQPGGLLTRALATVLAACEHGAVVWADVARKVEAAVRARRPGQHPVLVGPARRYLFALDTRALAGTTACITRGEVVWIVGGALTDVRVGDRHVVLPAVDLAASAAPRPAVAHLEVTAVHHQLARAACSSPGPLADGTTVAPVAWGSPRAAVTLITAGERRPHLAAALACAGQIRVLDPAAAPADDVPRIASVHAGATRLEIHGPSGEVVHAGLDLELTCAALERMARAAALRRLRSDAGLDPATHAFDLEWRAVDPPRPLAAGDALPATARVTARVHNRGVLPVYVTLFAAEADGRVRLLTASQPGGVELLPNGTYELGDARRGGVQGVKFVGPGARAGSDVALVAAILEEAVPLGAWETVEAEVTRRFDVAPTIVPPDFPQHPIRASIVVLDLRVAAVADSGQ